MDTCSSSGGGARTGAGLFVPPDVDVDVDGPEGCRVGLMSGLMSEYDIAKVLRRCICVLKRMESVELVVRMESTSGALAMFDRVALVVDGQRSR